MEIDSMKGYYAVFTSQRKGIMMRINLKIEILLNVQYRISSRLLQAIISTFIL
jgi:hypothetical protein